MVFLEWWEMYQRHFVSEIWRKKIDRLCTNAIWKYFWWINSIGWIMALWWDLMLCNWFFSVQIHSSSKLPLHKRSHFKCSQHSKLCRNVSMFKQYWKHLKIYFSIRNIKESSEGLYLYHRIVSLFWKCVWQETLYKSAFKYNLYLTFYAILNINFYCW